MEHAEVPRPDTTLPEVVAAEHLKANINRHDDSYYKYPQPTQPFSPLGHSSQYSNSPYVSAVTPYPHHTWNDGSTVGVKGFEKTSRKNFAALIALATFLFTALAIATGLGIPLAQCRNRLNPNNYSPLQPDKISNLKKGAYCNDRGQLTRDPLFTTRNGSASFDLKCGVILQEGLPALDPTSNVSSLQGTVRNIQTIVSYSVSDCIEACHSLNAMSEDKEKNSENPKCQSVTFIPALSGALSQGYGGNCFLKNSTLFDLSQASVSVVAVSAEVHRLREGT